LGKEKGRIQRIEERARERKNRVWEGFPGRKRKERKDGG
jgi:hypothetical protein